MKASDFVARYLAEQGVRLVYEVSGGMITHLLDSLHRHGKISVVSVHHEQAAAFAADATGRLTGVPGVAMATSGPGATNLLTGIGSCYFDSSPAVFITGQVNRHEMKGDRGVRQLGFQETDIVSMAKPLTKEAFRVDDPAELPRLLQRAFSVALSGRKGPVLVDIPMDVQRVDIPADSIPRAPVEAAAPGNLGLVEEALEALRKASRPLILLGGGVSSAGATPAVRELLARVRVPAVHSLMGVDVLPYAHPLRVGMIGSYGNRWANKAIGTCDVLLVLGSRLDVRQTGADTAAFKGDRKIFHVDCDSAEINNRVQGCQALSSDLQRFVDAVLQSLSPNRRIEAPGAWLEELARLRRELPDTRELAGVPGINPNTFMHQLSAASQAAGAYVVDVGQHQMWAAQSVELGERQRFLTSGGMGSMGFALPAAVGAALAIAPAPVVMIAGDGGFQCNIQELQTLVRNRLPIKLVIINNRCHGMVRQFQQSYFKERYQSTLWGYSAPDFIRVGEAYGVPSRTVDSVGAVNEALTWLWKSPGEPALLQVMVDTYANAYPKIAFGHPITEMEPEVKPLEMEST